ncbi:hypothetical protein EGM51_02485 [Verrucomicrobia bacterium S94]|nr:hypothetical protein EGM51_02485 [Verrucomicrobia bacterium S94]
MFPEIRSAASADIPPALPVDFKLFGIRRCIIDDHFFPVDHFLNNILFFDRRQTAPASGKPIGFRYKTEIKRPCRIFKKKLFEAGRMVIGLVARIRFPVALTDLHLSARPVFFARRLQTLHPGRNTYGISVPSDIRITNHSLGKRCGFIGTASGQNQQHTQQSIPSFFHDKSLSSCWIENKPTLTYYPSPMTYRPKHIAEYAALKFFQFCFNILPYRLALALGAGLGWFAFYVVRWRVANAKKRIREVFGDELSSRKVNRIAFLSMRYMFFNMVDVFRHRFWTPKQFRKHSNFHTASDRLHEHMKTGRGAICVTPHMGSWELGGRASEIYEVPLFFIVGTQRNPLFNKFLNELRGGTGSKALPRDDVLLLRKVMKNLKAGKILAMTNDLRSRTKGISVQFLGKEANMNGGMALFARQSKVPIFPMICYRESWTQHRCILFDPIEPDLSLSREDDWQRMTQLTMTMYEKEIRKRPEQYFWYNKRWVLDPFIEEAPEPSPDQSAPQEQTAP